MCGIFGEFSRNLIDRPEFMRILSLSKSRGPDSTEYYTNKKNLQLGFNRLSVIDLSDNGNQPIHSQNKRFTMVYNGEAYNYLEIRNKLEKLGYKFKGNGDSEVVINLLVDNEKVVVGFSGAGRPRELELRTTVKIEINDQEGKPIQPLDKLQIIRSVNFSDTDVLATQSHEAFHRSDIEKQLAIRIIERLQRIAP